MTNEEIAALIKRVDNLEKMMLKVEKLLKDNQSIEDFTRAIEKVLNNRSRDTKLTVLIILTTILVCLGVFGIFSLYQLAV